MYEGMLYCSFYSSVIFGIFHNKNNFRYTIHCYSKSYMHASLPCFHINGPWSFNRVLISPHSNSPMYLATVTNLCMPSFQTMDIIPYMHTQPHGVIADSSLSQPTHKDFIFINMVFFHIPLHLCFTSMALFIPIPISLFKNEPHS